MVDGNFLRSTKRNAGFCSVQNPTHTALDWTRRVSISALVGEPGRYASLISLPMKAVCGRTDRPHHDLLLYDLRRNDLRGRGSASHPVHLRVTAAFPSGPATAPRSPSLRKGRHLRIHVKSTFGTKEESPGGHPRIPSQSIGLPTAARCSTRPTRADSRTPASGPLPLQGARHAATPLESSPLHQRRSLFSRHALDHLQFQGIRSAEGVVRLPTRGPGPRILISPGYGPATPFGSKMDTPSCTLATPLISRSPKSTNKAQTIVGKTTRNSPAHRSPGGEGFPMDVAKDGRILASPVGRQPHPTRRRSNGSGLKK